MMLSEKQVEQMSLQSYLQTLKDDVDYNDVSAELGKRWETSVVAIKPFPICHLIHACADAALVHCPGSNLKLGSGLADVHAWRRHGVRCGLGSDGAACNNRLDSFHEMSLAAGIARVKHREDPVAARELVALATCDGAAALGLADHIGSLEVGKQADLVVIAKDRGHHGPFADRDPYTTLVHATRPDDVRLTMVAGRVLWENGAHTTLDAERDTADAVREAQALVQRAGFAGAAA
mgnify:CR=1 FL=1